MLYIRLKSAISGPIRRQKTPSNTIRRVPGRRIGRGEPRAPLHIRSERVPRGAGESDRDSIASPTRKLISNGLRPRENSPLRQKADGKNANSLDGGQDSIPAAAILMLSWPGLSGPPTPFFFLCRCKTWMPRNSSLPELRVLIPKSAAADLGDERGHGYSSRHSRACPLLRHARP